MTTTKDFKRLVRERMAKTGESYSIARMHVLHVRKTAGATPSTATPSTATLPSTPLPSTSAEPVWTYEWPFDGKDIAYDVLVAINDDLVEYVQSDDNPVGYTEFEELVFKNIDQDAGTAEYHVGFMAEHPSGDFDFNGHVEGDLAFDTLEDEDEDDLDDQDRKDMFLGSLKVTRADVHFDMGDPD